MTHKPTTCKQVKHDLSLLAGRDLTDRARIESVRRHMATCSDCRMRYRRLRNGLKVLASDRAAGTDGARVDGGTWTADERSLWPELSRRLDVRAASTVPRSGWRVTNWPPVVAMVAACGVMAAVLATPFGGSPAESMTVDTQAIKFDGSVESPVRDDKVIPADSKGMFQFKLIPPSER